MPVTPRNLSQTSLEYVKGMIAGLVEENEALLLNITILNRIKENLTAKIQALEANLHQLTFHQQHKNPHGNSKSSATQTTHEASANPDAPRPVPLPPLSSHPTNNIQQPKQPPSEVATLDGDVADNVIEIKRLSLADLPSTAALPGLVARHKISIERISRSVEQHAKAALSSGTPQKRQPSEKAVVCGFIKDLVLAACTVVGELYETILKLHHAPTPPLLVTSLATALATPRQKSIAATPRPKQAEPSAAAAAFSVDADPSPKKTGWFFNRSV